MDLSQTHRHEALEQAAGGEEPQDAERLRHEATRLKPQEEIREDHERSREDQPEIPGWFCSIHRGPIRTNNPPTNQPTNDQPTNHPSLHPSLRPTMGGVFRWESVCCGSPDIQPEGRSQRPRPDSQTESWKHTRPPSVDSGNIDITKCFHFSSFWIWHPVFVQWEQSVRGSEVIMFHLHNIQEEDLQGHAHSDRGHLVRGSAHCVAKLPGQRNRPRPLNKKISIFLIVCQLLWFCLFRTFTQKSHTEENLSCRTLNIKRFQTCQDMMELWPPKILSWFYL